MSPAENNDLVAAATERDLSFDRRNDERSHGGLEVPFVVIVQILAVSNEAER